LPANYNKPNGSYKGKPKFQLNKNSFLFNVDTLYYTIDCDNYDECLLDTDLLEQLLDGIDFMYDHEDEHKTIDIKLPGYKNAIEFKIMNGQRPFYQFSIRSQDMAFYFMKKKRNYFKTDSKDVTFPIKVQINQFILWEKGVQAAYQESLHMLAELGFILGQAKPNRIDLACHTDQWNFNYYDFKDFSYPLNVVGDNHPHYLRLNPHNGEFETVYHGDRSRLQLRIYNKSKEIQKKSKLYFYEIYEKYGLRPNMVWNIELEIHRDYLKEFVHPLTGKTGYYNDMDNLLNDEGISVLWTYLTKDKYGWDNTFWNQVIKGDKEKFYESKFRAVRVKDINADKMREVAQIRGRLMKMVLTEETKHGEELKRSINEFYNLIFDYEKDKKKDYTKEVNKKRKAYHNKIVNGLLSCTHKSIIELNNRVNQAKKIPSPDQEGN
jgi:hypothetical protein